MRKNNALYVVATPIGNDDDITLRAINTLKSADALICEEYRNGNRLLRKLNIENKEIISLNEHNEPAQIENILIRLAQGQSLALVSDCGTPLFSDPGHKLISEVSAAGFRVVPVPGASALTAAISVAPLHLKKFYFAGFLPPASEGRLAELRRIKSRQENIPVILMDTPYRLAAVLKDVCNIFGKEHKI
ncbi:MAG: hypothetical protein KBG27_05765, partial [Flexilinea sp.]|nr:hypothetical protein [Flexilinea sp.]